MRDSTRRAPTRHGKTDCEPRTPGKEKAPGGQHTTRAGASSRWRAGKLRFGAAMCDGRFPVSSPGGVSAARLPQSPEASAASSDLTAVAVSAESGSAPALNPVSGVLGAPGPTGFPSGVSPFEGPFGTRSASFGFGPCGPPPPVADEHVNISASNPQHFFFAEAAKTVKIDENQSKSARFSPFAPPHSHYDTPVTPVTPPLAPPLQEMSRLTA